MNLHMRSLECRSLCGESAFEATLVNVCVFADRAGFAGRGEVEGAVEVDCFGVRVIHPQPQMRCAVGRGPGDGLIHQSTPQTPAAAAGSNPRRSEVRMTRHLGTEVADRRAADIITIKHDIPHAAVLPARIGSAELCGQFVPVCIGERGFLSETPLAKRVWRIGQRSETNLLVEHAIIGLVGADVHAGKRRRIRNGRADRAGRREDRSLP